MNELKLKNEIRESIGSFKNIKDIFVYGIMHKLGVDDTDHNYAQIIGIIENDGDGLDEFVEETQN